MKPDVIAASDEACGPPRENPGTGSARSIAGAGTLLEAALTRENLKAAWKRVKANKGAAGVDGLDIEQTAQLLRTSWPQTRQALLSGTYRPQPVRRVMIPKSDGGQRELGIPTVRLRAIQLKHWKRPATIYRELKELGAGETVARRVAGNSRRWWRNSDGLLKTVLTIAYFDRLGVPRLS